MGLFKGMKGFASRQISHAFCRIFWQMESSELKTGLSDSQLARWFEVKAKNCRAHHTSEAPAPESGNKLDLDSQQGIWNLIIRPISVERCQPVSRHSSGCYVASKLAFGGDGNKGDGCVLLCVRRGGHAVTGRGLDPWVLSLHGDKVTLFPLYRQ